GNDGARCEQRIIRMELHPECFVADPQVAVAPAHHRVGHHRLDFLRHHADVSLLAAIIAESVKAEAVVEPAEQRDVVLEQQVGMTSATLSAAASAAAATPAAATAPAAGTTSARAAAAGATAACAGASTAGAAPARARVARAGSAGARGAGAGAAAASAGVPTTGAPGRHGAASGRATAGVNPAVPSRAAAPADAAHGVLA